MGNQVPAGRLMVFDDTTIYGFGRNFIPSGNAGQWRKGEFYRLFAAAKEPKPLEKKPAQPNNKRRNRAPKSRVDYKWSNRVEPEVRAMVLAGDLLFVAGPHGETHKKQAAFEGDEGIIRIAKGRMTTVCATLEPETGKLSAIPIPRAIREKLDP